VQPSILLHPLDFLGCDDERDLSFFPAMNLLAEEKMTVMERVLKMLARRFDVVPMREHAARASYAAGMKLTDPKFPQTLRKAA
jgi:hypothetical protein